MLLGRSSRSAAPTTRLSVDANAISVDVRQAGACTTVVVSGRVTVDFISSCAAGVARSDRRSATGRGRHRFHGGSISGHLRDRNAARRGAAPRDAS